MNLVFRNVFISVHTTKGTTISPTQISQIIHANICLIRTAPWAHPRNSHGIISRIDTACNGITDIVRRIPGTGGERGCDPCGGRGGILPPRPVHSPLMHGRSRPGVIEVHRRIHERARIHGVHLLSFIAVNVRVIVYPFHDLVDDADLGGLDKRRHKVGGRLDGESTGLASLCSRLNPEGAGRTRMAACRRADDRRGVATQEGIIQVSQGDIARHDGIPRERLERLRVDRVRQGDITGVRQVVVFLPVVILKAVLMVGNGPVIMGVPLNVEVIRRIAAQITPVRDAAGIHPAACHRHFKIGQLCLAIPYRRIAPVRAFVRGVGDPADRPLHVLRHIKGCGEGGFSAALRHVLE